MFYSVTFIIWTLLILVVIAKNTQNTFSSNCLAWLRMYCMDVFHYVADQLKDTPLFEATTKNTTLNGFGAIFNDFDNPNPFDNATHPGLSFSSQSTELSAANETLDQIISLPEVDHAILESDRVEGL